MPEIRVLIVDDEPLIRRGLRDGLSRMDDVNVIGECGNGAEAVAAILEQRPDLVLLDVQMPGCTGLEVVEHVGSERMPTVIFVTAYDEYAVKAFELHAIDYLLKPFDEDRLRESVDRARRKLSQENQSELIGRLQSLVQAGLPGKPARLVVKNNEAYEFVNVESIDWAESANNYVQLHCGTKSFLLGETLSHLEGRLAPHGFLRVHRFYLVNTERIATVHPMIHGTYVLQLRNGVRLGTGRQYKDAVRSLVGA
jgi:two-component system, LytTR family, response regulator